MSPAEIAKLWTLLGQTWGAKFFEQYGSQANEAWQMALAGVSPEAAKEALRQFIYEGQAFPPTLPEFVAAVRAWGRKQLKAQASRELLAVTDQPRSAPEVAAENLRKLRDLLAGL